VPSARFLVLIKGCAALAGLNSAVDPLINAVWRGRGRCGGDEAGEDRTGGADRDLLPDEAFPMPAARRETIRRLAQAVADGEIDLEPGADRAETERRLTDLPGVGPWTAGYVAMRGIGDPDVFLSTDLGARRGAAALGIPDDPKTLETYADRWRPWRSYALIRLWRSA
ncbi:MAG TPA: DNA-3-methyladenine glycosylase 2 family protein, partial [Micromonosporaceae bacterium]|nr:DNA-3-methyladenine glycosylase 2 family protein [Micromonosporaceae bacterium]